MNRISQWLEESSYLNTGSLTGVSLQVLGVLIFLFGILFDRTGYSKAIGISIFMILIGQLLITKYYDGPTVMGQINKGDS